MSRANWGGGGDPSGIFASLFDAFESRVRSATAEELRHAKEEQQAMDSDTYDRWKNGLLSDGEWLDYIARRVEATEGDPDEHQTWLELQREHTLAIKDAQAEAAFEAGSLSISSLITYYKSRMEDSVEEGPAYRELSQRYYQLVDRKLSDDIYAQAEQIIDRIERGQGTYQQLLSYYNSVLGQTRQNSDLRRQVQREIDQIQDLVDQVSGSGSSGGGGRRGGGSGLSDSQINDINAALVNLSRGGSPYSAAGPNVLPSIGEMARAQRADLDFIEDSYIADINRMTTINQFIKANPNATSVYDPMSGITYQITPEFLRSLDNQYLRTEELLFALQWTDGRPDDATKSLQYRQEYITNFMQPHNTEIIRPALDAQISGYFAGIVAGTAIADPYARQQFYERIGAAAIAHADSIEYEIKKASPNVYAGDDPDATRFQNVSKRDLPAELDVTGETQAELDFIRGFASIAGDRSMTTDERQTAFEELFRQRPEGFMFSEGDLAYFVNGDLGEENRQPHIGIMETSAQREGLRTGTWAYQDAGNGIVRAVPMDVVRATQTQAEAGGGQLVMTLERVGGVVQPVYRLTVPAAASPWQVWTDADGNLIPTSVIEGMTPDALAQSGYVRTDYSPGWQSMTYGGHTWYQDPTTKLWYRDRMPLNVKFDRYGAVVVGAGGDVSWDFKPFASAAGVVAPYFGIAPRDAQKGIEAAADAGLIDLSEYFTRDRNGQSTSENALIDGMYWDPEDDARRERAREAQEFRAESRARVERQQEIDWYNRMEARRRAEAQAAVDREYTREQQFQFRRMEGGTSLTDVRMWNMFGIDIDNINFGSPARQLSGSAIRLGGGLTAGADIAGKTSPLAMPAINTAPKTTTTTAPPSLAYTKLAGADTPGTAPLSPTKYIAPKVTYPAPKPAPAPTTSTTTTNPTGTSRLSGVSAL